MAGLLEYAPLISAGASVLMPVVWVVYLDLFWRSYRRQHRAKIIIAHGEGTGLGSLCLVSNMSAEPIHIEGVIVAAERGERRWARAITTFSDLESGAAPSTPSREGPLKSGDYIVLGTFRDLLGVAGTPVPDGAHQGGPPLDALAIWVVADLSSERDLVFARRRFRIRSHAGGIGFRPEELETRRITRADERREIEEILRSRLEEAMDRVPAERRGRPAEAQGGRD